MKPGDIVTIKMVISQRIENAQGEVSYSIKPIECDGWSSSVHLTETELNKAKVE